MHYWLFKSEPEEFSFNDLQQAELGRTVWDGVRNYQARNLMRDRMAVDDLAFFYHSSCKQPAIVGICRITATQVPDPSAFDSQSPYFDAKSTPDSPRWITVELCAEQALHNPVPLSLIKQQPVLDDMVLVRNPRLSVQPVSHQHWQAIMELAKR